MIKWKRNVAVGISALLMTFFALPGCSSITQVEDFFPYKNQTVVGKVMSYDIDSANVQLGKIDEEVQKTQKEPTINNLNYDFPQDDVYQLGNNAVFSVDMSKMDLDIQNIDGTTPLEEEATPIILDSDDIDIVHGGTYRAVGNTSDAVINIKSDEDVILMLSNISITSMDRPAIHATGKGKVSIYLEPDTTNTITLNSNSQIPSVSAISSESDLILYGTGTLNISSAATAIETDANFTAKDIRCDFTAKTENGVASEGNILFSNVTGKIDAMENALDCLDSKSQLGVINIQGATLDVLSRNSNAIAAHTLAYFNNNILNLGAAEDSIYCDNDIYYVSGDTIINAIDDGIHADQVCVIENGTIQIQSSKEGIEAEKMYFRGGMVNIVSSDDGMNAAEPELYDENEPQGYSEAKECFIGIGAGTYIVDAGGDGIDSNGSIQIIGGNIFVNGSTSSDNSALDYDNQGQLKGGNVIFAGSAGMAQGFSDLQQAYITTDVNGKENTTISIYDENGQVLLAYAPPKPYQMLIASAIGMEDGKEYSVIIGQIEQQIIIPSDEINTQDYCIEDITNIQNAIKVKATIQSENSSLGRPGMPQDTNGNFMGIPPESPSNKSFDNNEDQTDQDGNRQNDFMNNGQRPPEPPNGFNNNGNSMTPPDSFDDNNPMTPFENQKGEEKNTDSDGSVKENQLDNNTGIRKEETKEEKNATADKENTNTYDNSKQPHEILEYDGKIGDRTNSNKYNEKETDGKDNNENKTFSRNDEKYADSPSSNGTFEPYDYPEITIPIDKIEGQVSTGMLLSITFGESVNDIQEIKVINGTPNIVAPPENQDNNGMNDNNTKPPTENRQFSGNIGNAANEFTENSELSETTYESEVADENAVRITNGANVNLSGNIINKSGDTTSQDDSNFYGMNAGILALDNSNVSIINSSVDTDGSGANAVFSYGDGTIVNISDTTINTKKDNSGGIQTAGGGTTIANNLTVNTDGNSSAAIRSDRGGGTVEVDGGTYTTSGAGSPAIYSTANISAKNATLKANNSEGLVIEGKNSISLENCEVTSSMKGTYGNDSNENIHGIMLYQSMSGDASEGTSSLTVHGGKISTDVGDLFYVTNTDAEINLSEVELRLSEDNVLLRVAGNDGSRGWGRQNENGGDCKLTAQQQELKGNIIVDSISDLEVNFISGVSFEGAINPDNEGGEVDVIMTGGIWTLTGDSYISSLDMKSSSIEFNGFNLYVDGELYNK